MGTPHRLRTNTLDGGGGADTMTGGGGDDTFVVDAIGDTANENAGGGTDTVQSSVSYALGVNVEQLTLTGSAAINATGNALANTILGNAGANTLDGGGADTMTGGAGDDTFVFSAGFGDDTLSDFAVGVDKIDLSALNVGTFADLLGKTADIDGEAVVTLADGTISLSGVTKAQLVEGDFIGLDPDTAPTEPVNVLTGSVGADTIAGADGDDVLLGLGGHDVLIGGSGKDTLDGGDGYDVLFGDAGADTLHGGALSDVLFGGLDDDLLNGGDGNDWMLGEAGADHLNGGAGADVLNGGDGDDTLHGGAAADRLTGGAGQDTFAFVAMSDSGDLVFDFTAGGGGDVVDVAGLMVDVGFGGGGLEAFADGWVRTLQSGLDTLVQIDADGGGDGFATLATLQDVNESELTADNWAWA